MAEFCAQCAEPYPSDFTGVFAPTDWDKGYPVICEGCGPTLVDGDGNCMGLCMGSYHENTAHFRTPISRQLTAGGIV